MLKRANIIASSIWSLPGHGSVNVRAIAKLIALELVKAQEEGIAHEREECAKLAETLKTLKAWLPTNGDGTGENEHTTVHGEAIAKAIRSRSLQDAPGRRPAAPEDLHATGVATPSD